MVLASDFQATPSDGDQPGAFALFPYDRELVQRFREAFPRARWRGEEQGWFVPGTTAARRLDVWIAQELETLDRHADEKGRDAFLFEPLESAYLTVAEDLQVRTPYSHTIVDALRAIPWAHWNPDRKIWHVPFRSYEALRQRWPEIEEAARRNEPAERKRRREERKLRAEAEPSAAVQAERRRRRYPVPGDDLPPLDAPVSTRNWGVVVFEDIEEELVGESLPREIYPHAAEEPHRYVWARWRMPNLQEVYRARPPREADDERSVADRGWWLPTREELRERARKLRALERAQSARDQVRKDPLNA
jgi:hypothetical protein